jgi:ferrous iron transport protein A
MATLNDLKTGQSAVIREIQDGETAVQALRMGISPGERITCVAKIPAGPTVIQKGGMELAIGQGLCKQIEVELT